MDAAISRGVVGRAPLRVEASVERMTPKSLSPSYFLVVTASAALLAVSGCGSKAGTSAAATPASTTSTTGGTTKILAFAVSNENLNVDKVGLRDGYQRPDGNRDLAFTATIQGPIDALFVVSTNQKGEPGYGLRADTLVGHEEIPPELGGVIDTGKMTVGIGVTDKGGAKFINGESGSVHLADGVHNLSLYIANTATLHPGSFVRLYVKAGAALVPGPVTPY
jgi:hypothetical protein